MIDVSRFRIDDGKKFRLEDFPTNLGEELYESKSDYKDQIADLRKEISELQRLQYAHGKHALLTIFQAMDAAGKDSTIRAVFRGVNPHGYAVHAFKRPSEEEIDHSYLWRTDDHMPRRGHISVYNRSYYEEVLVVRVHPEIVTKYQKIPQERIGDIDELWEKRYRHIRDREHEAYENGTTTLKFFLNIGKTEQAKRFISRIDEREKNWKFSSGDIKERGFWDDYMKAYEEAIQETATDSSPWYCIPADDKKNMRLMVASVILQEMEKLPMEWPKLSEEETQELSVYREQLSNEL